MHSPNATDPSCTYPVSIPTTAEAWIDSASKMLPDYDSDWTNFLMIQ